VKTNLRLVVNPPATLTGCAYQAAPSWFAAAGVTRRTEPDTAALPASERPAVDVKLE
jgi:hypothetical protein